MNKKEVTVIIEGNKIKSLNSRYSTNGRKYKLVVNNVCPICGNGTTMDELNNTPFGLLPDYWTDALSESDEQFYIIGNYKCSSCKRAFIVRHLMKNNDSILKSIQSEIDKCNRKISAIDKDKSILRAANSMNKLQLDINNASLENKKMSIENELSEANAIEISQEVYPYYANNYFIRQEIQNISPKFYDIQKQCIIAKNIGLNELYGMGLRKSIEQLVTDYAINTHKDSRENVIKKLYMHVLMNT